METPVLDLQCECENCKRLFEWWENCDRDERAYYIATELFVAMHGSDVCDGNPKV